MSRVATTSIYGLIDPRTHTLRYVGKTVFAPRRRLAAHMWGARKERRKRHLFAWLVGLQERSIAPEIIILEEIAPGGDWEEAEKFWIAYFRFLGADLCNITIGGEGTAGRKASAEEVARLKARRGPLSPLYRVPKAAHVHEALRLGNERMRADPARWRSVVAKRRAGISPEGHERFRAATEALRADPIRHAAREAKRIAKCKTPEARRRVAVQSSEQWRTRREEIIAAQNAGKGEEYKRKQSEAKSQQWAKSDGPYAGVFLSADERDEIRALLASGLTGVAVARQWGLSESRVSQIKHGQ